MFKVNQEKCVGCGVCVDACPVGAISMSNGKAVINKQCVDCGRCLQACPQDAIQPLAELDQKVNFDQSRSSKGSSFSGGMGRGMGQGMGKGLGKGPRDGRGGGRGGGGKR